jgi:hypothetical protein
MLIRDIIILVSSALLSHCIQRFLPLLLCPQVFGYISLHSLNFLVTLKFSNPLESIEIRTTPKIILGDTPQYSHFLLLLVNELAQLLFNNLKGFFLNIAFIHKFSLLFNKHSGWMSYLN